MLCLAATAAGARVVSAYAPPAFQRLSAQFGHDRGRSQPAFTELRGLFQRSFGVSKKPPETGTQMIKALLAIFRESKSVFRASAIAHRQPGAGAALWRKEILLVAAETALNR